MSAVDGGGVEVKALTAKLSARRPSLDEQQWRLLLGAEAEAIGWGGMGVVARASGASRTTVSTGVKQVRAGVVHDGRVRGPGAGRPSVKRDSRASSRHWSRW